MHTAAANQVLVLTGEQNLNDIRSTTIEVAARWKFIGDMLGLSPGKLETIRVHNSKAEDCLREVILGWLQKAGYDFQQYGPPTWRWVVEAVASPAGGNNPELARRIAAQHPKGTYMLIAGLYRLYHVVFAHDALLPTNTNCSGAHCGTYSLFIYDRVGIIGTSIHL